MISKIKSISQLYTEVKDYDLVITNDAPLNTALNKEINKPMLGSFALTSKLLGTKYSEVLFEKEQLSLSQLVLKVQNDLKFNLKEALYFTKNILRIWQHLGSLEDVKKYVSKKEIKIIEYISKLPTYQSSMENMDLSFMEKENIAVIGEEIFTNLDKKVLTKEYTSITPFTDDEFFMDKIHLFNSQKEIIDRVVSMITKDNQNGVAIVLNIESQYLPLIKAKLINNGISLNEKLFLQQEFRTREYISIIESFYSLHNIFTKELIPIGNIFKIDIKSTKEDYLFLELIKADNNAKKVYDLLQDLKKKTFGELIQILKEYKLEVPYEVTELLHELNIFNEKINLKSFLELKYFIENFEQEIDVNKTGVLLIDAKNSSYINRDIIFYVGMDHSWTKNVEKQPYLDSDQEMGKNLDSFKILIQQGKERFIFVPKYSSGDDTIPPYYFNYLFDAKVEKFSKPFFDVEEVQNEPVETDFKPSNKSEDLEFENRETISNSSLNAFSQCPKKYAYGTLTSQAEKDFFMRGELVHSFAEFYVNHPKFVQDKELEEFVDIIIKELQLISNPFQTSLLRTQIRFACQSVIEFIDNQKIDENLNFESFEEISKKNQENLFAKHFELTIEKHNAELEFKDKKLQLNGIIDLAINSMLIVDYKTGKKKKVRDIIRKSNINDITSFSDFQPLVYLSVFRRINSDKEIQFWYSFPMINSYQRIVKEDLEDEVVKVHYIPQTFIDFFQTEAFFSIFKEDAPKYAENILSLISDFSYFKDKEITQDMLNNPGLFAESYTEDFAVHLVSSGMKENKTNLGSVPKILKSIFQFRIGEKSKQKEVYFFKDDLDKFEEFVKTQLEDLNKFYTTNFPFRPIEGETTCNSCNFKKICLKQWEGN